jgi:uncharacterized protein (TIGR03086 family)
VTVPATGRELLQQAIDYALASTDLVTAPLLPRPTPCATWNLGMLLCHFGDSVDALAEGLTDGAVSLTPVASPANITEPDAGPAGLLRARCTALRAATARPASAGLLIDIGGHDMTDAVFTCAGAIEVTVHGWDVSAACGNPRPIPPGLATSLLTAALVLLPPGDREGLFAPPLPPPPASGLGDQLLAFLGRASE